MVMDDLIGVERGARILSHLVREPVGWSPGFRKWFDGSTDGYPVEMKDEQT